jgi:dGTPase
MLQFSPEAHQGSTMPLYREGDYIREIKGAGTDFSKSEPYRSDFRRDYARLIHCASFRRLVGKTQLFPAIESDFFRNRLTHSLEVAQITKSIALKLNHEQKFLHQHGRIDTDLVEVAGLAHDLGHPPFGHNGELALDKCMLQHGGFEGNAQTLRILSRLEKRTTKDELGCGVTEEGQDLRFGLDLCARTLAAILKYDNEIPRRREEAGYGKPIKGYYASEAPLVRQIKAAVTGRSDFGGMMNTVECSIMDIADDIAYSTYDLEDAFKAGFTSPVEMLAADNELLEDIAEGIKNPAAGIDDVRGVLLAVFKDYLADFDSSARVGTGRLSGDDIVAAMNRHYRALSRIASVGYVRTEFTSELVGAFIGGIRFEPNLEYPALSHVYLEDDTRLKVEVLKRFTYTSLIMSSRLKVAEFRGQEIVKEMFDELVKPAGNRLLPDDFRRWTEFLEDESDRVRVVCDFIAGMTDRYAVEFYGRLRSESPQSIFKPI